MSPRFQRTAAWLALTAAVCAPHLAAAQQTQSDEPDPNITVQERPRPDYDPLGIRAGSFLIFPVPDLERPLRQQRVRHQERHRQSTLRGHRLAARSRSIRTGRGTR